MKRFLSGLAILGILLTGKAFALVDTSLCPQPPYAVSSGLPLFLSKATGTNFLLTRIGEMSLESQLKKELGAKFDVQIYPYGGKNLIDGKFKKITATSKNATIDGVHISSIKSESVCDYNHFVTKGDDVYSAENFLSKFDVNITSNDIQQTFAAGKFTKTLESMSVSMGNIIVFKVFEPSAAIRNNRFDLSMKIISPLITGGKTKTISMNMGLGVQDGQVQFTDIKLNQGSANVNLNALLPIINKLNPFMYETTLLKTKGSIVRINDIKMVNNSINIAGTVFIPKTTL